MGEYFSVTSAFTGLCVLARIHSAKWVRHPVEDFYEWSA
jgi:hypothetical protein